MSTSRLLTEKARRNVPGSLHGVSMLTPWHSCIWPSVWFVRLKHVENNFTSTFVNKLRLSTQKNCQMWENEGSQASSDRERKTEERPLVTQNSSQRTVVFIQTSNWASKYVFFLLSSRLKANAMDALCCFPSCEELKTPGMNGNHSWRVSKGHCCLWGWRKAHGNPLDTYKTSSVFVNVIFHNYKRPQTHL